MENDAVLIVINKDALDMLEHAGGFPFFPKFLTGTRPVMSQACRNGKTQGFRIHEGKHQHFACIGMGGNAGDTPLFIELGDESFFQEVFCEKI